MINENGRQKLEQDLLKDLLIISILLNFWEWNKFIDAHVRVRARMWLGITEWW